MVQLSMIAVVFTSVLSTMVAAKSCKTGGLYCGTYLLSKGDYINKITEKLAGASLQPTDQNIKNSLFACIEHGDVMLVRNCPGQCIGGDKKDDYCGAKPGTVIKKDFVA